MYLFRYNGCNVYFEQILSVNIFSNQFSNILYFKQFMYSLWTINGIQFPPVMFSSIKMIPSVDSMKRTLQISAQIFKGF